MSTKSVCVPPHMNFGGVSCIAGRFHVSRPRQHCTILMATIMLIIGSKATPGAGWPGPSSELAAKGLWRGHGTTWPEGPRPRRALPCHARGAAVARPRWIAATWPSRRPPPAWPLHRSQVRRRPPPPVRRGRPGCRPPALSFRPPAATGRPTSGTPSRTGGSGPPWTSSRPPPWGV